MNTLQPPQCDGPIDITEACLEAEKIGGVIYIPPGNYIKSRTFPKSNTTYIIDPNAVITQAIDGSNLWRIKGENIHFRCNGSLWQGQDGAVSSVFQFEDCDNCSIEYPNILNAGKDGINVTGNTYPYAKDCRIIGGKIDGSQRNGISVVAATGLMIDGVETCNSVKAPGAGIDVEANKFDMVEDITIKNVNSHHNGGIGIVVVFGDHITLENNRAHHNGSNGIGAGAGGAQFNSGVYRPQDKRGISAFDMATGNISAPDMELLPLGCLVQFPNSADALPDELKTQVRWVVTWKDETSFRVGKAADYDEVTSFSSAGSGTLDPDPEISDAILYSYVEGQCSNITLLNNKAWANGNIKDITIGLAVNVTSIGNRTPTIDGNIGISFSYTRNVENYSSRVSYPGLAGTSSGINYGLCTNVNSHDNTVINAGGSGIRGGSCSYALVRDERIINSRASRPFRWDAQVGSEIDRVMQ